jgi:hypothetical protein
MGGGGESEWAVAVWSVGPFGGVEWYRLDPITTGAESMQRRTI